MGSGLSCTTTCAWGKSLKAPQGKLLRLLLLNLIYPMRVRPVKRPAGTAGGKARRGEGGGGGARERASECV